MKRLSELMKLKLTIENHTILRVLTVTGLFIGSVAFVWTTRQVWILLLVAFFFALALNPPVSWLARKLPKRSRGLATALAYLLVILVLGLLLYALIPPLAKQGRELVNDFPTYIDSLETSDTFIARTARKFGVADDLRISKDEIAQNLSRAGNPLLTALKRITSSLVSILTVLVLTFFMLVEGPRWLTNFWALQPRGKEDHRRELAQRMYRVVTGYVNGQLLIALIAGVAAFIMLTVLSVPYALPLAAVATVLSLIPMIGATLTGVVLVIVGLFQSLTIGIVLLVFYVLYQQFENYVLQPKIQARNVEISPLTVLVAAIFGVTLAGLLGALLAIPVAACIRILVKDYIEVHHFAHRET
ncbi:AI-2E family transporter [Candidatus Microgenomates bacterium]|nr:AI-2E family transporter [Candidatus Microgenomates bacterium]